MSEESKKILELPKETAADVFKTQHNVYLFFNSICNGKMDRTLLKTRKENTLGGLYIVKLSHSERENSSTVNERSDSSNH